MVKSPGDVFAVTEDRETTEMGTTPVWASADFGALYQEHSNQVYYLALRLLGSPEQAQDAVQDVFIKAFKKLGQFRGDANVRTWLYRITINHCQNLLQTWHRRNMVSNADDAIWETAQGPEESPLSCLEAKELGERIQHTLDRLPEDYRILLLLVADEKLSYTEIGELTSQSADAVRGKLHRARKAFAGIFREYQ